MPPLKDLKGHRFGRLTVVDRLPTVNRRTMWLCKCECGNETIVDSQNLRTAHTQSCGCLHREMLSKSSTTHGNSKTRLYGIWNHMKTRCYVKSYHAFRHYGGRGITVCDEWANDFQAFYDWAMSHGYRDDLSIDRIDVNGNYEPSNCRWATQKEQVSNRRNAKK